MTLALLGAIIGAIWGWNRARRANGNRLDKLQYAAIYGILCALIGMIISIILNGSPFILSSKLLLFSN